MVVGVTYFTFLELRQGKHYRAQSKTTLLLVLATENASCKEQKDHYYVLQFFILVYC